MPYWFAKGYPVYLGKGETLVVNSLETARDALMHRGWKKRTGIRYERAIAAVMEAATDLAGAEKAFEIAARDAGVLVDRD